MSKVEILSYVFYVLLVYLKLSFAVCCNFGFSQFICNSIVLEARARSVEPVIHITAAYYVADYWGTYSLHVFLLFPKYWIRFLLVVWRFGEKWYHLVLHFFGIRYCFVHLYVYGGILINVIQFCIVALCLLRKISPNRRSFRLLQTQM